MRRYLLHFVCASLFLSLSISCSEEQNFDQFDDLEVTPLLASSILYIESTEDFINTSSVSGAFYSQTVNFDAFNEQFVSERLLEGIIIYEVENTTSKSINFTVEFLDEADNVLDVETFSIDPAPSGVLTREVAYGPAGKSLDILTATSTLRVTGSNLSDTTSTSSEPEPKFIFKSGAEFLFQLK
ncbi:hypothetical protein GTQ34_13385 [Muricauda sp. JGD-17]|uniref:Uncharacterized protein n=1 Tax=Flagellimonas ochracea TaxID=2696472 RepID=A0A964TDI4_9FLAO|nr:hypothetical protein [Allomuricauda ochracea]NAY92910.1 hypothetical protein [Allomuricauda ochracea]